MEYPQKLLLVNMPGKNNVISVLAISLSYMEIVTFHHITLQLVNKVRKPPSGFLN